MFEEVSTGAADDLAKVTDIARSMVVRYGMDDGLGNVAYEEERRSFLNPPIQLKAFATRIRAGSLPAPAAPATPLAAATAISPAK